MHMAAVESACKAAAMVSLRARLDRRERMCVVSKSFPKPEECTKTNISEFKYAEPKIGSTNSVVTSVKLSTPVTTTVTVTASTTITTSSAASAGSKIVSAKIDHFNTNTSVNLATRYFGRRSKTVPNRALKRRYIRPPKPISCKQPALKSLSSATSVSSGSEFHEEMVPKTEAPKETQSSQEMSSLIDIKVVKKRGKKPKGISKRTDFLMTDEVYNLPDRRTLHTSLNYCSQPLIDVPSWKFKPVTSFYQMEGTENINDPVFQRRHLKCEQDERRRKRWDIQRLREQKASEKLKYKYCRDTGKYSENNVQRKSFYPDLPNIQYLEVSNQLPVIAFGHLIPLFQPSDFTLPWKSGEISQNSDPTEVTPNRVAKKSRLSSTGSKVT